MARPVKYTWTLPTNDYVAPLQNVAAPGPLVLKTPIVFFQDQSRFVTLTSANNLSAANFTITGSSIAPYGETISETIAGPNANTVQTANQYREVYSITVNAPVVGVSAGIGLDGILGPFTYNFHDNNAHLSISTQVTNALVYTLFVTLGDITTLPIPASFAPIVAMTAANNNQLGEITQPITYAWFTINTVDPTATMTSIFIQQGLHS